MNRVIRRPLTVNRHLAQVLFFLVVGGVTFLIDVSVTLVCNHVLYFPPYLASAVGFLSGFFFNFPINRKKVFRHHAGDRFSLQTQVSLYAALSIANLVITSAIIQGLTVGAHVDIVVAKVIVTVMIATWNFLLFKFFVFAKTGPEPSVSPLS